MSAISLKSITGITSITTPSGVDNQLTLHNNNTTEAVKLDIAGNLHVNNQISVTGIITASQGLKINVSPAITIRDGTTEKGYIGFNANDPFIGRKNGVGLAFQNNKVRPVDGDDGSPSNNTVDLGEPTYRFKDGYFAGSLDIEGDIDVNGHTNLDNVSIAGVSTVTTFLQVLGQAGTSDKGFEVRSNSTQNTDTNKAIRIRNNSNTDTFNISYKGKVTATELDISGNIDVDGHTNLDNVSIAGITTFSNGPIVPNGQYYRGIINSGSQEKIIGGYISGTDTLRIGESMYLTSNGLGIGENSPEEELHITAATPVIRLEDSDTSRQSQIVGVDGNLRFDADNNNAQADSNISFRTDGSERLRITSTGQITTNVTSTIFADINTSNSNGAYCNFDIGANGANIGYLGSANHLVGGGANTDLAIRATNDFRLSTGGSTMRLYIQSTGQLTHSTSATVTTFNTSASNGAYLHLNYGGSGALTGYLGAGSHLISGSGVNDFGIRSANHFDISTGGSSRRLSIRSGGQVNIGGNYSETANKLTLTDTYKGFPSDSAQPEASFLLKLSSSNNRWIGIGASSTAAWIQASGPGSSGPTASLAINPAGGYVSIGTDVQDGLLTIKGNSDATSIPSIRLLDGSDTREVSITNTSGDFIASTHGTDNTQHGSIKIYDSGIIALATNSGAGNAERLRVDLNGGVRHMGTAGYWQITVIHNGSGSGNWYSGSAPQRIYPNYIDNRTGYAEFYLTFHPSTSYSGYGEPTFIITGESYLKTGGTIELNYNNRTNSPNNGVFRCYHGEYSWQIYNDGDTDQVSGQREINRNVEHRSSSYVASSTQSVDYIPTNDGRYGTNVEPIIDQRNYIKIKMNAVGSHNAIQNHTVFVKFTTYTQGDKTWQAYMQYN